MKGIYVLRDDLTALYIGTDDEDDDKAYPTFVSTSGRAAATKFDTVAAAEQAIKQFASYGNMIVVQF